jgi:hypothetical protein
VKDAVGQDPGLEAIFRQLGNCVERFCADEYSQGDLSEEIAGLRKRGKDQALCGCCHPKCQYRQNTDVSTDGALLPKASKADMSPRALAMTFNS